MSNLRFGWGFFRDLVDYSNATQTLYGQPQVKAEFLKLAASAPDSVTAGATARAGGGQGSATLITTDFTNVTTVATAGDSVKLPTAAAGLIYTVANNGATTLTLYPNTSDTIDGGSVNAGISVPPKSVVTLTAINATDWKTNTNRVGLPNIKRGVETAINSTGSVTAAQLVGGLITSTSAAATVITLPTATNLAAALGATQGTYFDFEVDNSNGANSVTLQVASGIQAITPAITGGGSLVVSTANLIGHFRITFTSATTAIIARLV